MESTDYTINYYPGTKLAILSYLVTILLERRRALFNALNVLEGFCLYQDDLLLRQGRRSRIKQHASD